MFKLGLLEVMTQLAGIQFLLEQEHQEAEEALQIQQQMENQEDLVVVE
jgi:hypothetical protein